MSEPRIDVMIDLETMGLDHDCIILTAAFVPFDIFTGDISNQSLYCTVNVEDQIEIGRSITWQTLQWWFEQDSEAIAEFMDNEGLGFKQWKNLVRDYFSALSLEFKDIIVWSNGENFDISILENVFRDKMPWKYYNARCVRTVVDMYLMMGFPKEPKKPFIGVKHNALDDCKNQIRYTTNMLKKIRRKHV